MGRGGVASKLKAWLMCVTIQCRTEMTDYDECRSNDGEIDLTA